MLHRYVLPILALAAAGFALTQMLAAHQTPTPATPPLEPARSPFGLQLAGAGIVEPESENLSIGSHLPGIVARVYVKVGDTIHAGEPLFQIDERQMKAELEARLASLASAEAQLEKLDRTPRQEELPPAEAMLAEAQANMKDQQLMYERTLRLDQNRAVSEEELIRRKMAVEVARAQQQKAAADLTLLQAGAWSYDKKVAAAAVTLAKAQVEQTRTELERLRVKAPRLDWDTSNRTAFRVLQVNVRPGEFVGNTPGTALIALGHVGQLHVRVDIDENDIPRFQPYQPGQATPRGNPSQKFPLKFVRVEPFVIPKKSLTGANTERVDTRVLQAIYAIEGGFPLYVGQQVDVFLNTAAP